MNGMPNAALRYQISRKRGVHKPEGGINCARPGKYGNPYQVSAGQSRERCLEMYRDLLELLDWQERNAIRKALSGHPLGCYCSLDEQCHVDFLLQIANSPIEDPPPVLPAPTKRPIRMELHF